MLGWQMDRLGSLQPSMTHAHMITYVHARCLKPVVGQATASMLDCLTTDSPASGYGLWACRMRLCLSDW